MELRKKIFGVAALAFAAALSAGVLSVNAAAEGEAALNGFEITATAVRTADPAGLRFQTVVGADAKTTYANAEVYTTLTFTAADTQTYTTNVPAAVWTTDGKGWNTVLLSVPASDYATEVTAQSFIKVDETTTYATETVTTSLAKTAAAALAAGQTGELLDTYVNAVATNVTLPATANVKLGKKAQLTATTTPAGYAVKWSSANKAVATVAADGTVTGVAGGTTTITATFGTKTATCEVTVADPTITYEDGQAGTVFSKLWMGNTEAGATTMAVTDFNGGKVYGAAVDETQDPYFYISYAWLAEKFADKSVQAITWDMYTTSERSYVRQYHVNANHWIKVDGGTTEITVGGATYYKTNLVFSRSLFYSWTANEDVKFRTNKTSELYFDNVGGEVDYATEYNFESGVNTILSQMGAGNNTHKQDFKMINVNGTATGVAYTNFEMSSSTRYWSVDMVWLDTMFADSSVDAIEFQVIADWSGTIDNLKIQYMSGKNILLKQGGAEAVTVDGETGFYRMTVQYTRAQHDAWKNSVTNGLMQFRFTGGGKATSEAMYFDNFKAVKGA